MVNAGEKTADIKACQAIEGKVTNKAVDAAQPAEAAKKKTVETSYEDR